jgi:hypothetical protein
LAVALAATMILLYFLLAFCAMWALDLPTLLLPVGAHAPRRAAAARPSSLPSIPELLQGLQAMAAPT